MRNNGIGAIDADDWPLVVDWRTAKFAELGFAWYEIPPELRWIGGYAHRRLCAAVGYAARDGSLLVHDVYCEPSLAGRRMLRMMLDYFEAVATTTGFPLVFAVPVLSVDHPMARHLAHWHYRPTLVMYAKEP